MDINRENYTRSLENIRPSEEFLAETKKLMLEEAAKIEKAEKPSRKPFIMKLTPLAAAAACITVIAAVGVNVLNSKNVDTVNSIAAEDTTAEESIEEAYDAGEDSGGNEVFSDAPVEEDAADEVRTVTADDVDDETADVQSDEPALFAVQEAVEDADADSFVSADEAETPANDEEETPQKANGYVDGGFHYTEKTPVDDGDGNADGNWGDEFNDDAFDDDEDDIINSNKPVSPAFTKLSGGNASAHTDFLPTDTAKLREFLALVSQDDINAEVMTSDGEIKDIFGERAYSLNDAFANAAEGLVPNVGDGFVPTVSFSFFDNVSGDVLYTVQTDGSVISVQIGCGETFCFTADDQAVRAVISAAE